MGVELMPASLSPSLFTLVRNFGLFSSLWLEQPLNFEPEWNVLRDEAGYALELLDRLWKREPERVENDGNEAPGCRESLRGV